MREDGLPHRGGGNARLPGCHCNKPDLGVAPRNAGGRAEGIRVQKFTQFPLSLPAPLGTQSIGRGGVFSDNCPSVSRLRTGFFDFPESEYHDGR